MKFDYVKSPGGGIEGDAFSLGNHYFLTVGRGNTDRHQQIRECYVNSADADATEIDIFPGPGGHTVIQDNGCGISSQEMLPFLTGLGCGKSKQGHQDHFGFGLKGVVAVHNMEAGVQVTSWVRHGPKVAFSLVLGRIDSEAGTIKIGVRKQLVDGKAVSLVKVDRPKGAAASGTRVDLFELPFNAEEIMKYLGSRFMRLPVENVYVWEKYGDVRTRRRVKGLLESIREVAQQEGRVELKNATVHWAIRKDTNGAAAAACMDGCVFYAWKNEAFQSWSLNRGGPSVLNSFGIWAGAPRVILLVEANDPKIEATMDRIGITGWDPFDVQQDFQKQMPAELSAFMLEWEAVHFDIQQEKDLFQGLLRLLKVMPLGSVQTPGPQGGTHGGTAPPRRRRHPRDDKDPDPPKLGRGYPDYTFTDDAELMGEPAVFDSGNNWVLINKEHPVIKAVLSKAEGRVQREQELRALVAAQIAGGVSSYISSYDENPDQTTMRAISSFPGMALLHAISGRKLRNLLKTSLGRD